MCYTKEDGTKVVCGTIHMYAVLWEGDGEQSWGSGMAVVQAWNVDDAIEFTRKFYRNHQSGYEIDIVDVDVLVGQVPGHRGVLIENGWFE